MNIEFLGNMALLEREMVAFLAPSRVSPVAVLPTLDWASDIVQTGKVVVSGFSSRMEKEVWSIFTRSSAPIVAVKVCKKYKKIPPIYSPLLADGRLLLVFLGIGVRLDRKNAVRRNAYVAQLAHEVVFPSLDEKSSLFSLYQKLKANNQNYTILSCF